MWLELSLAQGEHYLNKLSKVWARFYSDPFLFFDELDLKVFGRVQLNLFKFPHKLRRVIFLFSVILFAVWMLLGWDSGTGMLEYPILSLFDLFSGKISFDAWVQLPGEVYGKTMHFSAFVFYGLLYVGLSKHYDKIGIVNSKNVAYSFAFVCLSIAIFEYFWIYSFSHFQVQPWVSTWAWPQMRILLQNVSLLLVGLLAALYVYAEDTKLNFSRWTLLFFLLSVAGSLFWIYYPFQTEQITVLLTSGEWVSSKLFPQTLYTVDVDPLDSVNAGEWFYVQNPLLHGVNLLVKVLHSVTAYSLFKIIPLRRVIKK